ncbi:MAG: hypothetical protein ACRC62_20475 [Microcoleus sp.]
MTALTAAKMAFSINNQLTAEDLDENRKTAAAYKKNGKLILKSVTSFVENESCAVAEALRKASELGYSQVTVKVEFANFLNLDWKLIPWVCPIGSEREWADTDSWESFCVAQNLNPSEHIKRATYEYHSDKVSLLLWNLRKKVK